MLTLFKLVVDYGTILSDLWIINNGATGQMEYRKWTQM